jgi:hypothetical protein
MTSFLNQQRDQDLNHKLRHALRAEKIKIKTDGEQRTVLIPCSDMRSIGYIMLFEKNQLQQFFVRVLPFVSQHRRSQNRLSLLLVCKVTVDHEISSFDPSRNGGPP